MRNLSNILARAEKIPLLLLAQLIQPSQLQYFPSHIFRTDTGIKKKE